MNDKNPPQAALDQGHDLVWMPYPPKPHLHRWVCRVPGCQGIVVAECEGDEVWGSGMEERCKAKLSAC